MGILHERYNQYMPYFEYDQESAEEVMALLRAHTDLVIKKGTNKIIGQNEFFGSYSTSIHPIEINEITPYHRHDFYEMNFVFSGRLGQHIDGKTFVLEQGDLLLMSPSVYHTSLPIGRDTNSINILIQSSFVEHITSKMRSYSSTSYLQQLAKSTVYYVFKNTGSLGITDIIGELSTVLINPERYKPFTEMLVKNITEKLFICLNNAEKLSLSYQPPKTKLDKETRDKRIVQYISENYANISLEETAKYFGYSTQQIRRIVKESTGIKFSDYIKLTRMDNARHYLANTDMTVAEIAKHVGIESPEYFSRRFKYERGITPIEYRNRARKQKAKPN